MASTPSSYIPTNGSTVIRAKDELTIDSTLLPYSSTAMSIAMAGKVTYSDGDNGLSSVGAGGEACFYLWKLGSTDWIDCSIDGTTTRTGEVNVRQRQASSGLDDVASATDYLSPGVNQSFSIASRHEDGSINGAVSGTALTADNTPTALPDLSATDMQVAYDFMGTVSDFHMWGVSIGDDGLEASSA